MPFTRPISVALSLLLATVAGAQTLPTNKPLPFPQVDDARLTELAAQLVILHNVPGIGIAVVDSTGVRAMGVAGVRRAGEPTRLQPEDRFHLGSCGKAFTATLLARLAEQNKLSLGDALPKLLPDLALDSTYSAVTLTDLLTHRSGLAGDTLDDDQLPFLRLGANDPTASRGKLAARLLSIPTAHKPGIFKYSNYGYALAGYIAERAAKTSFESLLQTELFSPLGITTAGFGAPGTMGKEVIQPVGHADGAAPIAPGPYADNPPGLAPAGTIHMSLRDWGKFAALHLGGGPKDYLSSKSLALLHTPPAGVQGTDIDPAYAMGWGVTQTKGRLTLTHAGSNNYWFSQILLFPNEVSGGGGWGVLVVCNQGGDAAQKAVLDASKEIVALSH